MPTWEAANVAPRKKAQNKGVERNTETVEAALNRLSKAYSAAMECVGAWHRADSVSSKNNTDTIVLLKSLQQVGQAARSTFEKAILLDPLVATHAPLFTRVLRAWALDGTDSQKQRWAVIVLQKRSHPPSLSSAGHKSTVSKLSYLSLVNYADLLLAGCSCRGAAASLPATAAHNNNTVLDRGVVRSLRVLACSKSPCCCWNEHDKVGCSGNKSDNDDDNDDANDTQSDEVEQDTVRLAVTALIDASALDGSDPILWLKLACAARRLGRLQAKDNNLFPATLLSYRRLEKHALERARTCLPPNVPPNRTVVRAMQEWSGEEDAIVEFPQLLAPASQLEPETLTLELPRYSWSVLGRMLLRACRDGSAYSSDRNQRVQQRSKLGSSFASPVVSLRLSPMLTLPFSVLGAICQFLEPSSLMRLEATCRALSGAIISARAIMDHAALVKEEDEKKAQSLKWRDAATAQQQSQARGASNSRDDPMGEDSERNAAQTNRASKRVRSQIITSGKRAGRSARRSSTEYCLLAATLGCTADDEPFKGALETAIKWNQSFYCGRDANGPSPVRRGSMGPLPTRRGSMGKTPQHREEALERLSESALSVFVKRWSSCRSPPMGILFGFVSHVSLHVGSVYSADPGGSMVLTTCLVECFDLMIRRTRTDDILTPSWSAFGFSLPSNTVQSPTELFAIDLLHVELRFKSCERHELTDTDYDADVSIVFSMVPWLLSKLEEMNEGLAGSTKADTWLHLKARCFWLAAGFYLWMGRRCQNVSESREAETAGLGFVEDTLACLRLLIHRSVCLVRTPHLVSPGRTGPHWKELTVDYVTVFRNEIQAASVVLLAQEQFLEASSKVAGTTEESVLREEDRDALFAIGLALLERYTPSTDSPDAKHLELIDDFLSAYGDGLLSLPMTAEEDSSDTFGAKFDKLVPTGCVLAQDLLGLANPCILTILVTCLNMKSDKRTTVIQLLSRLVRALAGIGVDTEQPRRTLTEDDLDADQSDSDDESLMSDDESDESSRILRRTTDRMRYRQYGRLVQLLIGKIHSIFKEEMTADEKSTFALSDDCRGMLSASMGFSADLFQRSTGYKAKKESEQVEDLQVYLSIQTFVWTLRDCCGTADEPENGIARLYLTGLIRIIVQQRLILSTLVKGKSDSVSRSFLSQLKKRRSDFIAAVCCDLGLLLSNDCVHIDDGIVKRSGLFDEPEAGGEGGGEKLVVLCESLLWLWGAANGSELSTASGAGPDEVSGRKSAPTLDRPSRVRLQVPVAVALSGVCGSAVATKNSGSWSGTVEGVSSGPVGESVSLAEFYDSDTSAMDWLADAGDDETESAETRREELLRVISQAVYSIKHIVGSITEDDMSSYSFYNEYMTVDGPLLPLVASRVLNTFASSLLIGFVPDDFEEDARMHLWSDYAFGTRTTGVLLDSVLHKVYKNLHGFTLVSTHDGRDTSGGGPITGDGSKMKRFLPEHPAAGASLYRCIMRAYSHGRKSPPKASLETVLASLPPPAESENTTQIRKYLFANSGDQFELKDLVSLVSKDSNWEAHFSTMNGWDWDNIQSKPDNAVAEDEAAVVRKGIASLLAQGPLPTFQDAGSESDARESTLHTEEEFSKKFSAIVDDLCLGNTADCESWHKAAQCLTAKADLVADRLGLSKGFSRSRDFFVAERQSLPEASLGLTELLSEQERETQLSCSTEVGDAYAEVLPHDDDNGSAFKAQVWREIESLYNKKDFVGWQQAWGGLFVSTLRAISVRCMCLGIYILYKKNEQSTEASLLVSEISEFLGVTLYSQLMGSQVYGYPLRVLTDQQKREFAEASLVCFERALDASLSPDEQKSDNGQITWDLHFMIGKCHEKVAGTYQREMFPAGLQTELTKVGRSYERHEEKALQSYVKALLEAKALDKDGGVVEQNGGSAHGPGEVLYRLHASRLKCLIRAVDRKEDEREHAECEALRLTECHWFTKQDEAAKPQDIRDRIWSVLADIVSALAQCRLDQPFFHRSVYRHAQALMWAPVLCDPVGERANGSFGMVPATRAFKLRGLNFSTNAASSGMVIISTLFEKKHSQLCAVWVTATGSASTFQTINNAVRKYDSLRGKYIGAYLDCLRLCNRKNELEAFFRWTSSCKRDLPSYFAASALAAGGKPEQAHSRDSLLIKGRLMASHHFLTTVKRQCNSAVASVLLHQATTADSSQDTKAAENHLKAAYACFLRLNCGADDLTRGRAVKFHRKAAGVEEIIELLTATFLKVNKDQPVSGPRSDWSGEGQKTDVLRLALEKCKVLFPTLSGALFSRKRSPKPKKTDDSSPATGKKRPRDPSPRKSTTKRSFEVKVPAGLSAGDHFLVSVRASGVEKKVKLTVPEGTPATLRFALEVPAADTGNGNDNDPTKS